jgi:hypothetical protein
VECKSNGYTATDPTKKDPEAFFRTQPCLEEDALASVNKLSAGAAACLRLDIFRDG